MIILRIKYKVLTFKSIDNLSLVTDKRTRFLFCCKRTLNTVCTDYFNAFQKKWNSRVFLNIEVWYSSVWLNPMTGKMRKILCFDWLPEHILPVRDFPRQSRKEKLSFSPYNKSFNDQQTCSLKMAGYWPLSILRFYWPCLRLGRKMKDL